jgi:acetyltransferase-like isoleucine patch superfamily enzyme
MKNIVNSIIEGLIRNISGGLGRKIRYYYYKKKFKTCGKNVVIDIGVKISNPSLISVGNNVWIDDYVILLAGKVNSKNIFHKANTAYLGEDGELIIGDSVHIAPFTLIQCHGGVSIGAKSGIAAGSKIYSMSHHYRNLTNRNDLSSYFFTPMVNEEEQYLILSPVSIGNGCAVGLNSVVLPGANLPDGSWLGVSTFFSGQNNKENSIYAVESAKLIKEK